MFIYDNMLLNFS